ncbi:MAG: ATP-binding protein [Candidatus Riflebacteria bacterium]|nr:ATP-binding protein [Candidatus Riflebacteria bacterium]
MHARIKQLIEELPPDATHMKMHVQGSPETLALIRRVIAACVQHLDLSAALLNDIKLATTEACTNVIKHAYKFDDSMSFDLKITTSEEVFVVEVFYNDPGFIPANIPVPNLNEIKEGGLGVFIIKNIMDHVDYITDGESGRVRLQMVKILKLQDNSGGQSEDRLPD